MGSCASLHRFPLGSKTNKLVIPQSPIKDHDKQINGHRPIDDVSVKPTNFVDYGSKEESFFDSKAWLDSDCEDDFFSVKGDFTPSRGSTPVHHSFSTSIPRFNIPNSIPQPSPTKKKLSELFKESFRDDDDKDDVNNIGNQNPSKNQVKSTINTNLPPNSSNGTPYVSGTNSVCSSERTVNGEALPEKEKPIRCIPSLVSCRSFGERRKKMNVRMSPAIAVNGES